MTSVGGVSIGSEDAKKCEVNFDRMGIHRLIRENKPLRPLTGHTFLANRLRGSQNGLLASTTAPVLASYFAAGVRRDVFVRDIVWRRGCVPSASGTTRGFPPRPTDAGRRDAEGPPGPRARSSAALFSPNRIRCITRKNNANIDNAV